MLLIRRLYIFSLNCNLLLIVPFSLKFHSIQCTANPIPNDDDRFDHLCGVKCPEIRKDFGIYRRVLRLGGRLHSDALVLHKPLQNGGWRICEKRNTHLQTVLPHLYHCGRLSGRLHFDLLECTRHGRGGNLCAALLCWRMELKRTLFCLEFLG